MNYKYYKDKRSKLEPNAIFVAIWGSESDCNEGNIMTYAPIGQHSEASIEYVKECKEIDLETYKKVSDGIYTPLEYLGYTMESELDNFIRIGRKLSDLWDNDKIKYYPNYLPSFDEFLSDFSRILEGEDKLDG